jgi:hypothetical protein
MRNISYALQGCFQVQMMHEDFAQDSLMSGTPGNNISRLHRMRHNEARGGCHVGSQTRHSLVWSAVSLVSLCFRSPLTEYVLALLQVLRDACNTVTLDAKIRLRSFLEVTSYTVDWSLSLQKCTGRLRPPLSLSCCEQPNFVGKLKDDQLDSVSETSLDLKFMMQVRSLLSGKITDFGPVPETLKIDTL